ncbi:Kinesin-like protein KIF3C [Acropora cervicornis]|uniref:Kinesin-like protein KIF3C n=1 Tax=Acropora cervicornis TaxID=6130 RepID=A0AAD9R3B4_ACRCE|nr:Kinesin-like protein KIF3C [Acropora cervicornis]
MKDQKAIKSRQGESDRIRVYVRVRPRTFEEANRQESLGVDVESSRSQVSLNDSRERRYKFDKIFSPQASNAEVYNAVGKPLVDAVFSGFNGTLMAYGQTGTGKTHTVMSSDGMCVHVVEKLFKRIKLDKYHDYQVQVSYLQIYQEKIYDLLNINSKVELVMREDPKKGVYVENLSSFIVRDTTDILSLIRQGKKKLIFGETRMNRASSRSHSIFRITVERACSTGSKKSATSGVTSASESNLASSSPVKPSLSCALSSRKSAQSTSSLDRLREETTPKRLPPKSGSIGKQSFIPRKTSTPARSDTCRHTLHLTSLPEISLPALSQPNRWSLIDTSHGFSGAGVSSRSLNSPSDSEGSELQFSMDSLLESGTESERWDDDEDESFLESIKIGEDVLITGRINICDLAGSERIKKTGAEGERLSELQHVNLSLLELGNTIHALSEGKRTHIPYRNSPLTRLLQDSLGGNCKTSFVLCISPLLRDVNETRCTLDFGQRALKISSTAYVNINIDYMKLSQDLRKRCEIQELEIKSQKENFEKQNIAIQSDAELKLAEIQALLEAERDRHKIEITNLEKEKENLAKALFDERSQRRVLEGIHHASLEAALLVDRQRILNNEENEKTPPKNALDEERRRSSVIEQRMKEEYDRALADEHKRAEMVKQLEQEGLGKALEEEKRRLGELEERLQKSPGHERYTQTAAMLEETEFPRMPPGTNQTETLYNVLLAEIMSLQLLYQMQDLSQACSADNPQSRDSGCAEYEDDVIHCVSSTVLEKGGLLLNNLRARQRGESRFSLQSTDSLRELYFVQFPQSPRLSRDSRKTGSVPIIPVKSSLAELKCESKKSFSSTDSVEVCRERNGSSSSSMESFLDDEPLKLRCRNRPIDSGCSSLQSDFDHSSKGGEVQLSDSTGRTRANTYPAKLCNASTCVPLAEEEDEDLEFLGDVVERDEIQSVKNKVVHLKNDLCRLKTELDSETVNFFSEVFGVEVPFLREGELSRVMRQNSEITGEDGQDLDLDPPLLEEAVNLLLVNKTVMSCILVLQNREDSQMSHESTRTEFPTVIRAPLKVDCGVQVDLEQVRSLRRRIRKHAGVMTDPPEKIQNCHKECQTSAQEISNGETTETFPNRDLETSQDPWLRKSQYSLERVLHNSAHLLTREPDGASVNEDRLANREANGDHMESQSDNSMGSHLGMDLHEPRGKKIKKASIFSCLCTTRLSSRKKTKKAGKSKKENTEVVKTI